jgi:hypothetical protein
MAIALILSLLVFCVGLIAMCFFGGVEEEDL